MSKILLIPCTRKEWRRFSSTHFDLVPCAPLHTAQWRGSICHLAQVDGVERAIIVALQDMADDSWYADKIILTLPKEHPAYSRLLAAIADAQAQYFASKGLRFAARRGSEKKRGTKCCAVSAVTN